MKIEHSLPIKLMYPSSEVELQINILMIENITCILKVKSEKKKNLLFSCLVKKKFQYSTVSHHFLL